MELGGISEMKIKMKKTLVIVFSAVFVVGLGIYGYKKNVNSRKYIDVMPISYISSMGMGSETYTSGIVSSNQVQEIYLENQQTIKEVFVKDGDQVNVGDKLFSYDTIMLELDMEAQKIQIQQIDAKIKSLKSELQVLKNTNPTKKSTVTSNHIVLGKNTDFTSKIFSSDESVKKILLLGSKDNSNKICNVKTVEKGNEEAILYKTIDIDSKPYTGDGTVDNPYRFLCTSDVVIVGGFMNKLMGYDVNGSNKEKNSLVAVFEVRRGDVKDGNLLSLWTVDGAIYKPVSTDGKWSFGFVSNEKNSPEDKPEEKPEEFEPPVQEEGYTKAELAKLIAEKEEELRSQELNKRETELACEKITKSLNKSTVLSKFQGVVKIQVSKEEMATQTPYMVVNGGEGFYVTGNISELLLEQLKIGDMITAQLWSENWTMQYNAVVSEISEYPTTNTDYYSGGTGNTNVSYYPFTAFIKEAEGLANGQYVDLAMRPFREVDMNSLYIHKSYIREEDGKNYVYVADENNRLAKRYVKVGKTRNGEEIDVIEGITQEDRIAFPYGKNVKEGIKVKEQESDYNNFK